MIQVTYDMCRVVNVIRHWVESYSYDFEPNAPLREKLERFLESVREKHLCKAAQSILKQLAEKVLLCRVLSIAYSILTVLYSYVRHMSTRNILVRAVH